MGVKEVVERVARVAAEVGAHIPEAQTVDWTSPKASQQAVDTAAARKASDDVARREAALEKAFKRYP